MDGVPQMPSSALAHAPTCERCGAVLAVSPKGRLIDCPCFEARLSQAPAPVAPVRVRLVADPLDDTPAPHNGTATSRLAAAHAETETQRTRNRILALVESEGGLTCDELEVRFGMPHQSVAPRLWELEKAGRLVKTAERRRTRAGELAHVYNLATGGEA